MAAVQYEHPRVCSICFGIQGLPLPGDPVRTVRFCPTEWPQHRCMHCCSCDHCTALNSLIWRIRNAVDHFLHLDDDSFAKYCRLKADK